MVRALAEESSLDEPTNGSLGLVCLHGRAIGNSRPNVKRGRAARAAAGLPRPDQTAATERERTVASHPLRMTPGSDGGRALVSERLDCPDPGRRCFAPPIHARWPAAASTGRRVCAWDGVPAGGPGDRATARVGTCTSKRRQDHSEGGLAASEDERVWAIQNGELYNYPELRGLLTGAGHRFRTRSDAELIPHAYEEFGERFAERLNGMFAIAPWDERTRRGLVVRDRLGIKPLYYARSDELLVFGSELKSVLASGRVEPELDYEAIDIYLSLGYFPAPLRRCSGCASSLRARCS